MLCLTALHLLNNLEKPLTSWPAVQGNHGNLSCPAEEKNKIPGFELSHLRPSDSFTLQLTLCKVCFRLIRVSNCARPVQVRCIPWQLEILLWSWPGCLWTHQYGKINFVSEHQQFLQILLLKLFLFSALNINKVNNTQYNITSVSEPETSTPKL